MAPLLFMTEKILPVVQNQHLLLCTLLMCNAAAMEVLLPGMRYLPFVILYNVDNFKAYVCRHSQFFLTVWLQLGEPFSSQ